MLRRLRDIDKQYWQPLKNYVINTFDRAERNKLKKINYIEYIYLDTNGNIINNQTAKQLKQFVYYELKLKQTKTNIYYLEIVLYYAHKNKLTIKYLEFSVILNKKFTSMRNKYSMLLDNGNKGQYLKHKMELLKSV